MDARGPTVHTVRRFGIMDSNCMASGNFQKGWDGGEGRWGKDGGSMETAKAVMPQPGVGV